MKVFTDYSEDSAHMLRVWVRSWKQHGWTPQLIFNRVAKSGRSLKVTPFVINFGFRLRSRKFIAQYGKRGWKTAGLVRFPVDATEDTVLNCGRTI